MQKETLDITGTDLFRLSVFCCESYRCVWVQHNDSLHNLQDSIQYYHKQSGWQNEINNHAQSTVKIYILHLADSFIQSDLQMRSTQVIHSKETVRIAVKHSTKLYRTS